MLKKILPFLAIIALFVACNNQTNEQEATDDIPVISVNDFEAKAAEYAGQEIIIEGMANHVCQHSGKRLFIIEDNEDVTVKIIPDDEIGSFDAEMEGSNIRVAGTVVEDYVINEEFLAEWEAEIIAMHEKEAAETTEEEVQEEMATEEEHEDSHAEVKSNTESGDGAGHGEHHLKGMEKVEKARQKLIESGKEELPIYMVKANKVEKINE